MLFLFKVLCKAAAPLWPLGFRGCFLEWLPWLQHQRTSELRIAIGTRRPMGTLAHPDEMAGQWPVWPLQSTLCTDSYSAPLSTSTWSGRCGPASPILTPPFWHVLVGASAGHSGRRCPIFLSVFAGMAPLLSQLEVRLFWRTAGPLGWVRGNCCPAAPVVTGVCLSWSFALNCQQMCRLWISLSNYTTSHVISKPWNLSRQ